MAKLWDDERAVWEAKQIHQRFNAHRERLHWRRLSRNNDESEDPMLGEILENGEPAEGNPFVRLTKYQSTKIRSTGHLLIPKLCENPTLVSAQAEREDSIINPVANDLAQVFQTWLSDIEETSGESIAQAISAPQVWDCYGIIHTLRTELPKVDFLWTDTLPTDPQEAKKWIAYSEVAHLQDPVVSTCPDCAGLGIISNGDPYAPEYTDCATCDGLKTVMEGPKGQGLYRETAKAYTERLAEIRAESGPGWTIRFPDPEQFSFVLDQDPRGGFAKVVWIYEVGKLDYEEALGESNGASTPTITSAEMEQPAPGMQQTFGLANISETTISSQDWDKRLQVAQVWTRECYYEIVSEIGGQASECKKKFEHDYGCVPFWIAPALDGYQRDPVHRYEPYLEVLYRQKKFIDRQLTLVAGMAELTAQPLLYFTQNANAMAAQLPTGDPSDEQENSAGGTALPQGMGVTTIPIQISTGVGNVLNILRQLEEEGTPQTGIVNIQAQTQPWTARQALSQAGVGPSVLVENRRKVIQRVIDCWQNWHIRHPEELMYAKRKDDPRKVVAVDPKLIKNIKVSVSISKIGSAEQVAYAQHLMDTYDRGWVKREDVLRDGFARRNPTDYSNGLDVEHILKPLKDAYITRRVTAIVGKEFTMGVNGDIVNSSGQTAQPQDALTANGWQIPQQVTPGQSNQNPMGLQQPQGQNTPQAQGEAGIQGGGARMTLPALSAPGQYQMPGVR